MTEPDLLLTKPAKTNSPVQVQNPAPSIRPIRSEEKPNEDEREFDESSQRHMKAAGRMLYEIILDWKRDQDERKGKCEVMVETTKIV